MIKRLITKPLLYEEIITLIFESIKKGEILPGEKFPPERILEEKWGVSRNVLREAFHILESKGLVISIQGKGRFLRSLPEEELSKYLGSYELITKLEKSSLLDIYEVRKILEAYAIELIIERASLQEITVIEDEYSNFVDELKTYGVIETDFKLHELYAKTSHNYMLEQMILLQLKLISEFKNPSFSSMVLEHNSEDYIKEHELIIKNIKGKNVIEAKTAICRHLDKTIAMIKLK